MNEPATASPSDRFQFSVKLLLGLMLAMFAYLFCTAGALLFCPVAAWRNPNWLSLGPLSIAAIDAGTVVLSILTPFD